MGERVEISEEMLDRLIEFLEHLGGESLPVAADAERRSVLGQLCHETGR